MIIQKRTGETIKLEVAVNDDLGAPITLTDSVAKFAYKRIYPDLSEVVIRAATVNENKLSATLASSETLIAGKYEYEFKVKINGEESSIETGEITLVEALVKGL